MTSSGKLFVSQLSLESFQPRIQPKIVTLIACKNKKGEYLLYKRKLEPFKKRVGFPYGKIHLGEGVREAATRELEEKTGLSARLKHCGIAYLTIYQAGQLAAHMLCHVFSGKNPEGNLRNYSKIGKTFWKTIENPSSKEFMPGFCDIYGLIKKSPNRLFFKEIIAE